MEIEELKTRARLKLNEEKVQLWEPPYTTENGDAGQQLQELANKYGEEMKVTSDVMYDVLNQLRLHALEKLAARKRFKQDGLASVKVRLAGNIPHQMVQEGVRGNEIDIQVSLTANGQALKKLIATKCDIDEFHMKLIASGHVLDDNRSLQEQHVKNSGLVMAIFLSQTEIEARKQDEQFSQVARAREAAQFMSNQEEDDKTEHGSYYLQIADQTGRPLDLPREERKALVVAMALHEKGRVALKKRKYADALLLLLEADGEFKKCRSDILKMVDNYALVCLEVVWCYLCLQNISDLPDAEVRLRTCDECFRKSYGPNLERLALVKGKTGAEKALFMRLHLLQGILAFHQRNMDEAGRLFARAETELKTLEIDGEKMAEVMGLGFSKRETQLALRACDGNVPVAVEYIMKKREEKKELKEKEKEEKRVKHVQRTLGKTADGQPVKMELYESLMSMGFPKGAAAEALRQTNNNIFQASQVLHDNPDLLNLPDPKTPDVKITDDMISQLMCMGFELEAARAALYKFHGAVQSAMDELLKRGGTVPVEWYRDIPSTSSSGTSGSSASSGSSSGASGSSGSSSAASPVKSATEIKKEKEMIDSIIQDLPQDEDDHLDISLEDEARFLQEYQTLLASLTF